MTALALLLCLSVQGAALFGSEAAEECAATLRDEERVYAINGRKIANAAEFGQHWQGMKPGDKASVAVDRGKYSFTLEVVRIK